MIVFCSSLTPIGLISNHSSSQSLAIAEGGIPYPLSREERRKKCSVTPHSIDAIFFLC
jgi:hypothetical protein